MSSFPLTKACDADTRDSLATGPAPGWPDFRVCNRHAESLRTGTVPSFVGDEAHGWRRPRLVLPRGGVTSLGQNSLIITPASNDEAHELVMAVAAESDDVGQIAGRGE